MRVDVVVSVLVSAHGETRAHKRAMQEQRNARRARSRKRFEFWGAVAAAIGVQRAAE